MAAATAVVVVVVVMAMDIAASPIQPVHNTRSATPIDSYSGRECGYDKPVR